MAQNDSTASAGTARDLNEFRRRLVFLAVAGMAFVGTEIGRFIYRPWVRANNFGDFGLAESIGNLGGIVVQIFVVLTIVKAAKPKSFALAGLMAVGYVVYEFVQPYLPKGVFDWNDVLGTVIGFGIASVVLSGIWRILPARFNE